MNYYECANRPRAGKVVIFMPGLFCWCTLNPLVWKLTCWALIYGKQFPFLISPGHIPPFESWAGQSFQHETQTSHSKGPFLCLSLYLPLPTHSPTHFTSVCLSNPILTKLSDSFVLISAFCTFLPGNSFNLLVLLKSRKSYWNPFSELLPVIKWMQYEGVIWPEELTKGSHVLDSWFEIIVT